MATRRRRLTEEEYLSFFDAAEHRTGPKTRDEIIEHLTKKNSYRMWRLRHDFKWLKRQMRKLGLNPEDARELL